jgi:sugar lactone lactonase YvrE
LWLLAGLVLAGYGLGLIAGADAFQAYIVRDGLLAALAGGLVFARHVALLPLLPLPLRRRIWPALGQLLFLTAVACSLAATGVLALLGGQGWPAWLGGSLWIVALGLWAAALLWRGAADYAPPAYRWTRDAAGRIVRLALEGDSVESLPTTPTNNQRLMFGLLIVLAVGWGLRLWRLAALPPDCLDVECAQALRLVDGSWQQGLAASSASLYALLAALIYQIGGDGLLALRAAAALLGCGTLPVFYWAARAYTRPAGALLGLALLALSPWHLWASRMGEVWMAAPLLLLLAVGAGARAFQARNLRWAGVAGGGLGLLLAQPLPLQGATAVYLAVAAALVGWVFRRDTGSPARAGVGITLGSALIVGLPLALPAWRGQMDGLSAGAAAWWAGLAALLHGGGAPLPLLLDSSLLPPAVGAAALAGLLTLAGARRRTDAFLPLFGLLIYGALGSAARLPALGLLAWLPFLYLGAAVALDQAVSAFDAAWARLVALPRVVAVALALILAFLGPQAATLPRQWRAPASGQNAVEVAMGRYLATCLAGQNGDDLCAQTGEGAPIFFVPPAVLAHPSTQLLLGAQIDETRVRALDVGRDLLPTTAPQGSLVYLVALDNQPLIDLLQQLYPGAQLHTEPRDQAGPARFLVYAISRDEVLAHQGLAGTYRGGDSEELRQDGPLAFAWGDDPPLPRPFEVAWEGSLLLPVAGTYLFQIEGSAPHAPDPVVSMQLDGRLVLDTSLGLVEQTEHLAQGYARLTLRYRTTGAPGNWAIRWQPPEGSNEPIPREALYSPPLPDIGLIGTYHAGDGWQGPALAVRKELVLGAAVDLPSPYSVVWSGKLAVPRAGETLFAVTANGPVQLSVAGQPLLDYLPPARVGEGPAFSQASIYLQRGWQPLEVRYAPPQGQPDLRLLWQPPGSSPMNLLSRYLLPTTAEVTTGDVPLPPAPDLIDTRLGDDSFALSTSMETYQPARTLPPQSLPPLLAEMRRQVGSICGAGQDQFNLPHGLALDADAGRLYVADTGNRRVVALDVETGASAQVYTTDEFQEPVDVALPPDGSLLVLDALAGTIFRIDRATGEVAPLAIQTGFYRPRGLGVDSGGRIAVADTGGARVVLLDATGAVLTQFGGPATLLGQGQPVDVLALGDTLWTVTAENGRLWRLDVLGSLVALPRNNTIDGPHLAALPNGTFFLSHPAGRGLLYFAASGQPSAQVAHGGSLVAPTGLAAALRGDRVILAVADSAACQVTIWEARVD